MSLDFSGTISVRAGSQEAFSRLTDVQWISGCLPTLTELRIISESEFEATFKVDVSEAARRVHVEYLSQVTVKMKFKFLKKEPQEVILEGSGRVVGSSLKIRIEFKVTDSGNGSVIPWRATVDAGLLLRFFGEALIKETADQIIDSVIRCISSKLS